MPGPECPGRFGLLAEIFAEYEIRESERKTMDISFNNFFDAGYSSCASQLMSFPDLVNQEKSRTIQHKIIDCLLTFICTRLSTNERQLESVSEKCPVSV